MQKEERHPWRKNRARDEYWGTGPRKMPLNGEGGVLENRGAWYLLVLRHLRRGGAPPAQDSIQRGAYGNGNNSERYKCPVKNGLSATRQNKR